MYTKEDVLNYVKEEDVKFIRLVFVTINGIQKNISIMDSELKEVFDHGKCIDASFVNEFAKYGKLVLHPDPNTISVLPWRPSQGRVIRMFCSITTVSNQILLSDTRLLLMNALEKLKTDIKIRTEFEFYLFKLDEEGNNTLIPYDSASYMDIAPLDKGENVRREICLSLHEMEIATSGSFHSFGPGQNKISLKEDEPLKSSENAITFESVVKTIAARNGLYADFRHKPLENEVSSKHSICIKTDEKNIEAYYQNIKAHYDEMYIFLNNTNHLYGSYDEETNVELDIFNHEIKINRVSYTSNPFLTYMLIICCLNDTSVNTIKATSRSKALISASESEFIKKYIPEEIRNLYLK